MHVNEATFQDLEEFLVLGQSRKAAGAASQDLREEIEGRRQYEGLNWSVLQLVVNELHGRGVQLLALALQDLMSSGIPCECLPLRAQELLIAHPLLPDGGLEEGIYNGQASSYQLVQLLWLLKASQERLEFGRVERREEGNE